MLAIRHFQAIALPVSTVRFNNFHKYDSRLALTISQLSDRMLF
jgi:hypothetical protein